MGIMIALFAALFIGSTSVVAAKMGGSATQQAFGMTMGAVIFGILTTALYVLPTAGAQYAFNSHIWLVGLGSGLCWSIGQVGQYAAMKPLGVSIALPISTAGQVVGNALLAAIVLGEWRTWQVWIIGIVAIILVAGGAILTSIQPHTGDAIPREKFRAGIIYLAASTAGFMLYFIFPNLMHRIQFIPDSLYGQPNNTGLYYMTSIILPQSIGQIIGVALIMTALRRGANRERFFTTLTFRNILTGLVWAVGNVCIFIACASPSAGQAVATTLSQLGVIVATFGGIVVLHERKTRTQVRFIILGCIMLAVGAILMGLYTTK